MLLVLMIHAYRFTMNMFARRCPPCSVCPLSPATKITPYDRSVRSILSTIAYPAVTAALLLLLLLLLTLVYFILCVCGNVHPSTEISILRRGYTPNLEETYPWTCSVKLVRVCVCVCVHPTRCLDLFSTHPGKVAAPPTGSQAIDRHSSIVAPSPVHIHTRVGFYRALGLALSFARRCSLDTAWPARNVLAAPRC